MKTIGLIGGMSWQSSAHYYRLINEEVARLRGGLHSAPILLHSLDFAPIAEMQAEGRWQDAGALLGQSARRLEEAGAGVIGLATNTMHVVAEAILGSISVPFVHIADPTAARLLSDGCRTAGLLGTRFTMEMGFYIERMESLGIKALVPGVGHTDLNAIIYDELCVGIISERSRQTYIEAIARLAGMGAEAVILGCTEISMLIDDSVSPLPVYDTTQLHAEALVQAALG